jgi:putative toxin-antitoxin system antitoxin component (TIGR02293 family)
MAQNIRIVSEELRRTLGFFSAEIVFAAAADRTASESKAPVGKSARNKKVFFSMSSDDELLLETSAIDLLASRLDVESSSLLQVSRIPARTFQRRQAEGKSLSETETDRVLRIARVASLAERVFEDSEKARRWLSKENRMLGARPLELLASDQGTHEVEAELNRIELGDFA